MSYMYCEIAAISVRGEPRATETHLPVADSPEELYAFLRLSHDLMPEIGFERALEASERAGGVIDVNEGDEIYAVGAPILRTIPLLSRIVNNYDPPTREDFLLYTYSV
jgi:hypothetical protein